MPQDAVTAPATATHYRWTDRPEDRPMPLLARRRVIGEQAMISHVRLQRGCVIPAHAHANEQFVCILEGCLRFDLGDSAATDRRRLDVRAGEVLHLPANVLHAAEAVEDTLVLDVFSPPSERTGIDRE